MQRGAIAALDEGDEFVRSNIERARTSRDILCDALIATNRVQTRKPDGALYAFLKIDGIDDPRAAARACGLLALVGMQDQADRACNALAYGGNERPVGVDVSLDQGWLCIAVANGGEPIAAMIGNYTFGPSSPDMKLLSYVASVGAMAHAPFVMAAGNPAQAQNVHQEGPRRKGYTSQRLTVLKQMYKLLYRKGLTLDAASKEIEALKGQVPEAAPDVDMMLDFLAQAQRGIVR